MAGITEKVDKAVLPDVFEVLFFVYLCNTKMCTYQRECCGHNYVTHECTCKYVYLCILNTITTARISLSRYDSVVQALYGMGEMAYGISQLQAAAWFDAVVRVNAGMISQLQAAAWLIQQQLGVNAAEYGMAYSQAWQGNGICQSQSAAWWDIVAKSQAWQ